MNTTAIDKELVRIEAALDNLRRLTTPVDEKLADQLVRYLQQGLTRVVADETTFRSLPGRQKSYSERHRQLVSLLENLLGDIKLYDLGAQSDTLEHFITRAGQAPETSQPE